MILLRIVCSVVVIICSGFLAYNYIKINNQLEELKRKSQKEFKQKSQKEKQLFSLLGVKGGRL